MQRKKPKPRQTPKRKSKQRREAQVSLAEISSSAANTKKTRRKKMTAKGGISVNSARIWRKAWKKERPFSLATGILSLMRLLPRVKDA